jgi:ATP-dependent phosphofructokinase / diphosphate-dependent phosphofructokinase
MAGKNAFYAQSGGVTAVINASACGVLQTARQHSDEIGKVYAGRAGIIGALTEDLIDTSLESDAAITALKHTPGAAFGSCRYKLASIHEHRAQYERLIEVFQAHDIGFFSTMVAGTRRTRRIKSVRLAQRWPTRSCASEFPRLWTMTYPLLTVHPALAQRQNISPPAFGRSRSTCRR